MTETIMITKNPGYFLVEIYLDHATQKLDEDTDIQKYSLKVIQNYMFKHTKLAQPKLEHIQSQECLAIRESLRIQVPSDDYS